MSYIFESFQQKYRDEGLRDIFNITSSPLYEGSEVCDVLSIPGTPYDLISKDSTSMWHSKVDMYGWMIFEYPSKLMTISGYKILTETKCCTLKNHYLKGSNDSINWFEIAHITSNTPIDNRGKWVTYEVPKSTFRMYKIEEEQSDLGSYCINEKWFGLRSVDFFTTNISDITYNHKGEKISIYCFQPSIFRALLIILSHSFTYY